MGHVLVVCAVVDKDKLRFGASPHEAQAHYPWELIIRVVQLQLIEDDAAEMFLACGQLGDGMAIRPDFADVIIRFATTGPRAWTAAGVWRTKSA